MPHAQETRTTILCRPQNNGITQCHCIAQKISSHWRGWKIMKHGNIQNNVLICNDQGVQTIILTTNFHTNQNASIKFNQETCFQFFASIQSNVNSLPINNIDDEGPMKNTIKGKKKITKINFDGSIEVHSRKPR